MLTVSVEGFGFSASVRTVVTQGLERFIDAKAVCPAQRTPPREGAPMGMDLQMDWVHIPDDEGRPWGTWCEEWTQADASAFNDAAQYLRQTVKNKTGAKDWVDDLDAALPNSFSVLIPGTTKLLNAYDAAMKVVAITPEPMMDPGPPPLPAPPKPPKSKLPWIIGGVALLGMLGVGTIIYTRKD